MHIGYRISDRDGLLLLHSPDLIAQMALERMGRNRE
jgi:hypothetical protein